MKGLARRFDAVTSRAESAAQSLGYQRYLAELAPIVDVVAAAVTPFLGVKLGLYAALGLSSTTLTHDVAIGITAALVVLLRLAARWKWLANLVAWWNAAPKVEAAALSTKDLTALQDAINRFDVDQGATAGAVTGQGEEINRLRDRVAALEGERQAQEAPKPARARRAREKGRTAPQTTETTSKETGK